MGMDDHFAERATKENTAPPSEKRLLISWSDLKDLFDIVSSLSLSGVSLPATTLDSLIRLRTKLLRTRHESVNVLTETPAEMNALESTYRERGLKFLEQTVSDAVVAAKRKASQMFLFEPIRQAAASLPGAISPLLAAVNPGVFRAFSVSADPIQNVCGVGLGDNGESVRIYVNRKIPNRLVPKAMRLPDDIDGVPTEVIETGPFRVLSGVGRQRPVQPGYCVGAHELNQSVLTSGTIGAIVTIEGDSQNRYLLSNSHVIAAGLPRGSPIFQPSIFHNGDPLTDAIAVLHHDWPIDPLGPNEVDCALGRITDPASAESAIRMFGKLASDQPIAAALQMDVVKVGSETDQTAGKIVDIAADIKVSFPDGTYQFVDQILIEPNRNSPHKAFAVEGDSGSLVMSESSREPVGLLFSGSQRGYALANHLTAVLSRLKVKIVV